MQHFEAIEDTFPDDVPDCHVALISLRPLDEEWVVRLTVRPGTDSTVQRSAEAWTAREVMRLALDPAATSEWDESVLPEGVLLMQKYASVEHLEGL